MTKKSKKKKVSKKRLLALLTRRNILIGVIAVFFLIQYFQIQSIFGTFSFLQGRDSSLITELGQVKEAYGQFGEDLNEIRGFLRMSTKEYGGFEEPEQVEGDTAKNENQLQLALFQYVSYLADQEGLEARVANHKSFLEGLVASEEFSTFLFDQELYLSKIVEDDYSIILYINNADGKSVFLYYLSKEDGMLSLKTVKSEEKVVVENVEELQAQAMEFIQNEKEGLLESMAAANEKLDQIETAINSQETRVELANLGISLTTNYAEKNLKIIYSVYSKAKELIGEIVFDPVTLKISLVDKKDSSASLEVTDISTALVPFLQKLDARTFFELKTDDALAELKNTLVDKGFQLLLSESGLTISEDFYEYGDRIYYDIFDADGNKLSSLVIEKATGVINVVAPDGTSPENILFFDPDFKKKTLAIPDVIPEFEDTPGHAENTFNILIAGKHGNLVDTMIFAHLDEDKRTVRMVSIPRDLHYNGRKINSFAYYYGMPELKKVLSDLTGYELDKYILIEMYAFIDVIDLVGGIDIHLDSAVIDPTYRTVDDGVEGTLYYEPGDYHLGGVEALRLARTRHTSSDFARAERQQMILEALQDKARNFGFGDADTIYEIAKTVLNKTETDISLDDAIAYYFRYQDYKIESNAVMSSGNVLYVPPYITWEDCHELIAEAEAAEQPKPDCESKNHAYTLIPRNDNWNIVKWFFKENFEAV